MLRDMSERSDATSGSPSPLGRDAIRNQDSGTKPERRGPPPNPLYHPLFLPVLLVAFTMWFGWDAFLTSDPDMAKHQTFNLIMYLAMQPICFKNVPRGIREFLEDQQAAVAAQKQRSTA